MELQRKEAQRSPISDEKIIKLYWLRNEKAIEETDMKYKKYLFSVAYNIVCDCEECLNDTYIGAWNCYTTLTTECTQGIPYDDRAQNCNQPLS